MPDKTENAALTSDRRQFLESATVANALPLQQDGAKKELIVRSEAPLNAEPALHHLIQSWITPIRHFYVRNHAPTPQLDAATFRFSIEGMVQKRLSMSLAELKDRFRHVSAVATMTCAGNRREEHSRVKKVSGVQWGAGPIGNAEWMGVRLSDVLKTAGLKNGAKHVWFESVDRIEKGDDVIPFGASIPLDKALADSPDMPGALLAFGMNGKPLPADHGYPVRTVVPGYIGARSVKWLGKIVVSDRPSPNHYLARAYKLVTDGTEAEWQSAKPIYEFPHNSVICRPAAGDALASGRVRVAGYALPAGVRGRTIAKVEVSTDGGRSWLAAKLHRESRAYCWRLWQADLIVNRRTTDLTVRAVDSAGSVQPRTVNWNLKGYLFNAWHRIPVKVS